MQEFLDMGGYAVFVWTAYCLSALALIGFAVLTVKANKDTRAEVETLRPKRRKG